MISVSNIEENDPNECIQFLGVSSENQTKNSNVSPKYVTNVPNTILNDRIIHRIAHNGRNCGKNSRLFHQIKAVCKVPWIIILISAIQIVIYFVACNDYVALLIFTPRRKFDIWRFFTYHTVHFSLTHLLLNVGLQILIALPLESEQGHLRIIIVYICGVVFGALGSLVINSTQSIIGSSAGVYSLLLSHISQCILNWTTISHRNFRLFAVSMLFSGDVFYSSYRYIYWNNIEPKISLAAHLSGGIAGFAIGLLVFKKRTEDTNQKYQFDFDAVI